MGRPPKRQKSQKNYNEDDNFEEYRLNRMNTAKNRSKLDIDENDNDDIQRNEDSSQAIQQTLDIVLDKIQAMAQDIANLVSQVGDLNSKMQAINISNNNKLPNIDDFSNTTSNEDSPFDSPQNAQILKTDVINAEENSTKGPFPRYEAIDRVVPRPSTKELANSMGGKTHSLQFTCNLYIDLISRVLGPSSKTGLDYKAMVKEAILVTKAVLSHIKEINNIDPDLRWSRLDPTIKLDAYRKLEAATEHLLPLKVCSEFWGAHVLISNFWLKRKKKSNNNTTTAQPNIKRKRSTYIESKDNPAGASTPTSTTPPLVITTPIRTTPPVATSPPPASPLCFSSTTSPREETKRHKPEAFSIPFLTHQ
ncbi:hypothetical protein [Parasitella parasitica]|uniref:Uncharacterized protein n=1 Tax=Parasitella parasitica TaxID=35722 RepID=A0A0B7MR71_9FUNG|nr:hypothetical protein [Parasitella parasitica]